MRGMLAGAVCCAAVCRAGGTDSAGSPADGWVSRFSRKPQAQTACDGVRVDRCGFCWVLSETPLVLSRPHTAGRQRQPPRKGEDQVGEGDFVQLRESAIPLPLTHAGSIARLDGTCTSAPVMGRAPSLDRCPCRHNYRVRCPDCHHEMFVAFSCKHAAY